MKIMLLGFTDSGKSHLLGSLFTLSFEIGPAGFSVRPKNFKEDNEIVRIYRAVEAKKQIPSNQNIKSAQLILRQGLQTIDDIELIDVVGQAMRPGTNTRLAADIEQGTSDCDGFIILVNAPHTESERLQSSQELSQSLNFIAPVLEKKQGIPVVLVINKIDSLPAANELKNKIENEKLRIRTENPQSSVQDIENIIEKQLGQRIATHITPCLNNTAINRIITQFFRLLNNNNTHPNKVFPCTNFGFDNYPATNNNNYRLEPYGTNAAFLWVIYASLVFKHQQKGLRTTPDKRIEDLRVDIEHIFKSGNAYFDDEHSEEIWHSQNIRELYSNTLRPQSW